MKNNNVCAVYSLVDLINTLVKDNFIRLDIVECTFDDTYTIKLSWMNGVYSTKKVFSGDELLKDNGKSIAEFIQQETGYDVYGDIKEIASCEKQKKSKDGIKVEKIRDGVSINEFISTITLLDYGEIIRCVARASYGKDKLYYLKKARLYLNRLINRALQEESQRQEEVKKYCEEDIVATLDMFDYINSAFGAEIFPTKRGEEKNRRP